MPTNAPLTGGAAWSTFVTIISPPWIDDVVSGRVQSFTEIAEREGKVERHIRLLTPLAFLPPRTLAAIIDGTGPHDATVTALEQAVPYRWDGIPGP